MKIEWGSEVISIPAIGLEIRPMRHFYRRPLVLMPDRFRGVCEATPVFVPVDVRWTWKRVLFQSGNWLHPVGGYRHTARVVDPDEAAR